MSQNADTFLKLCEDSTKHPNVFEFLSETPDLSAREQVEVILVDQYCRWQRQQAIPVEHYLQRLTDIEDRLLVPVLVEEFGYLEQRGIAPDALDFVRRYESLDAEAFVLLCEELEVDASADRLAAADASAAGGSGNSKREIGRYEVLCSIGQGAFGEVFLAKDPTLDRSVAIKVLSQERTDAGTNPDELLREARVIAKLDHPHIVPVFDFGRMDDGDCFIVSKYIKGKDLRSELRKSISPVQAARITASLANALHAAHRVGVVHRDVKPGNVILDEKRVPYLLDFGLALRERGDHSEGVYAGTPAYMSPEQKRGEAVDGRTDIYSLGITLYEMLAKRRPFPNQSDTETSAQSGSLEPQPPRQFVETIPRELERICLKALARNPGDRYNTASDFAEDLESWLGQNQVTTVTPGNDSSGPSDSDSGMDSGNASPTGGAGGEQTESRFANKRWWVAGSIALLLAVLFALDRFQLIDSRAAIQKWSDNYLPDFARGYLSDGWTLKPDYESGFFYRSQPLLERAQQSDPSVMSVAVKTTAPRFKPIQIAWSPQGDRLAVVTRRGQLRIYHWNGQELELRLIYRSDTSNDWIRCFRWHPFDGSAAIATGRGIVIGTSSERGDYDISLLIGKVYETESIDCLVDQGRVLYVFGSKTGFRAWDPLTETIYENFLPPSGTHFESTGLSNQYVLAVGESGEDAGIEWWEASWNPGSDEGTSGDRQHQWRFSRRSRLSESLPRTKADDITGLRLSEDQQHLSVISRNNISVYRLGENLNPLGKFSLYDSHEGTALFQFIPSRWRTQRNLSKEPTVVWRDAAKILRGTVDRPSTENPSATDELPMVDTLSTSMLGKKLQDSVFALHPSKELIAVAYAGGLELWNSRLETVGRVPSVDCVWDVIPMQLHDKCVLLRPDGGGMIVRTRGEPLGSIIPPVAKELSGLDVIERNSVVEPELHFVQSTYQSDRLPAQRNLTDFGITAVTTPSKQTFSLIPKLVFVDQFDKPASGAFSGGGDWHFGTTYLPSGVGDLTQIDRRFHSVVADSEEQMALAQRAQKVVLCDSEGNYSVRRLSAIDDPPQTSGRLGETNQYLSIAADPNATTLFTGIGGPGETKIGAIDLATGTPLWNRQLEGVENGVNLVWLQDRLLATSWFGWRWIDARWGEVLDDVSPRPEHGIRHGQVRQHPLEGTLFSWHRYPEVEPAASWSRDLDLQWLAFAAGDGQWLILSPTGRLIGQVVAEQPLTNRFVGPSPDRYRPATWADGAQPVITRPSDSLTLVRYHSDGRTTCIPFEPLRE